MPPLSNDPVIRIEPRPIEEILAGVRLWWRLTCDLLEEMEAQEKARLAEVNSAPGTAPAVGAAGTKRRVRPAGGMGK